jgi:hypothetical protein
MGLIVPIGLANATPPEEEGVDGDRTGLETGPGTPLPFSRECSSKRECLTCASRMSRRENSGALALLGLAKSVTGNARLRGMQNMSVSGPRPGANAGPIPGRRDSWGRAP